MAYNGQSEYVRLTGMFKSQKNARLYSATVGEEQLQQLARATAEAVRDGRTIMMCFWNNAPKPNSLSYKVCDEGQQGNRRPERQADRQPAGRQGKPAYQPYKKKEEIPMEDVIEDNSGDFDNVPF